MFVPFLWLEKPFVFIYHEDGTCYLCSLDTHKGAVEICKENWRQDYRVATFFQFSHNGVEMPHLVIYHASGDIFIEHVDEPTVPN